MNSCFVAPYSDFCLITMANGEREQLWKERIEQWRSSGLSQRAFAMRHGYAVRQVGCSVRRLTKAVPARAMMPVVLKPAPAQAAPLRCCVLHKVG